MIDHEAQRLANDIFDAVKQAFSAEYPDVAAWHGYGMACMHARDKFIRATAKAMEDERFATLFPEEGPRYARILLTRECLLENAARFAGL